MRTYEYVPGLGVVPKGTKGPASVLWRLRRAAGSFESSEIISDLEARGFEEHELLRRLRRRAMVLRACEPELAAELDHCASRAGAAE